MNGYGYNKNNYKKHIFCANCGCIGHVYKSCNHPVISYGIICYTLFYDMEANIVYPKYLMVQRKDSLSYVEFIRGKYDIQNRSYLLKLFSNMTNEERDKIRHTAKFDILWANMWCRGKNEKENNKNFVRELQEAMNKFNALKNGIFIVLQNETNETVMFNLDYLLDNTTPVYTETEWGFPKGRRNINEDDLSCAIREFKEETGVHESSIRICHDYKPCDEIFSGTNKIRYKHVYYISKYITTNLQYSFKHQCKEIKNVQWFTYTQAQDHIRDYNIERKELLKRINNMIMRSTFVF